MNGGMYALGCSILFLFRRRPLLLLRGTSNAAIDLLEAEKEATVN